MIQQILNSTKTMILLLQKAHYIDNSMPILLQKIEGLELEIDKNSQLVETKIPTASFESFVALLLPFLIKLHSHIEENIQKKATDNNTDILSDWKIFEQSWNRLNSSQNKNSIANVGRSSSHPAAFVGGLIQGNPLGITGSSNLLENLSVEDLQNVLVATNAVLNKNNLEDSKEEPKNPESVVTNQPENTQVRNLEVEKEQKSKKITVHREVQVVAPKRVSRKEGFTITVLFAKKIEDLQLTSLQEQDICFPIDFETTEKYPVVQVMIRTSDFQLISSSCQEFPLGFRNIDKVKFHLATYPQLQKLSKGELSIDILYKNTFIYSCDIIIPIEDSTQQFQKKNILDFQDIFAIHQEENQIEEFLSQNICEEENLPFILQLAYKEIVERETYFEKASSIHHAFENFLIYHLSVAMGDEEEVPWAEQKGNTTLGLQRNYFETILESKKWKRKVRKKIPYLHHFQQPFIKKIISQIIYYRNRFWAHNYRTPTKDQCKLLFECFFKKIQVLFFVMHETFPHFLLVVDEEMNVTTLPSDPKLSLEYQSLATGVYWCMENSEPIKTMMAMDICKVCNHKHLVYNLGEIEEKRPVLGICLI